MTCVVTLITTLEFILLWNDLWGSFEERERNHNLIYTMKCEEDNTLYKVAWFFQFKKYVKQRRFTWKCISCICKWRSSMAWMKFFLGGSRIVWEKGEIYTLGT